MGKECKKSRNTVGIAMLILVTLLLTLQSCGTTKNSACSGFMWGAANNCPAYR
jgi:hypothetical protein